jgi:hypothetical protein
MQYLEIEHMADRNIPCEDSSNLRELQKVQLANKTRSLLCKQYALINRIAMIAAHEYEHGDEDSLGNAMITIEALARTAEEIVEPIFGYLPMMNEEETAEVAHG